MSIFFFFSDKGARVAAYLVAAAFLSLSSSVLSRARAETADFIYWKQLGQKRVEDGGVTADFELRGAEGAEKIEIYYSAIPFKSPRAGKFDPSLVEIFYLEPSPETQTIRLYSGRFELVELWARIVRNDRVFVAQTRMNLYGESEKGRETEFVRVPALPPLPSVKVYRSRDIPNPDAESVEQEGVDAYHAYTYSVMQTGEAALIRLATPPVAGTETQYAAETQRAMLVYEEDVFSAVVNASSRYFAYTFPDYPELANASLFAWKNVYLVFDTRDLVISCAVPVYRAPYGQMNLKAGLILLTAAVAVSAALVVVYDTRKRKVKI